MAEIVFIHGAADSSAVWEHQVVVFGREHDVFAIDLPGHGARLSERALDSVEALATETVRAARARGMAQPVLVGHSMGGATVQRIALDDPSFARALVLVGTGARLRIRPELIKSARELAAASPPGQVVRRLVTLDDAVSEDASVESRSWLIERFGKATGDAVHADFRATNGFDALERVGEIRLPTLIVAGEDDRWTPPKFQSYMAEEIAGSRLVMFPRTGHYPFVERAARFNAELSRFLMDLETA